MKPWVFSIGVHLAFGAFLFSIGSSESSRIDAARVSRVVPLTITLPPRPKIPSVTTRRLQPRVFRTTAVKARSLPALVDVPNPDLNVSPTSTALPALPERWLLPPPPPKTDNLTAVVIAAPALGRVSNLQLAGFPTVASDNTPKPSVQARSAGFGDAALAEATPSQRAIRTEPLRGISKPVEILSKPRPAYTDEARRLRLEGEVLLEVLFSASGSAHVNRLLRGLGHGLDESATAAATAIRYRPAEKAGVPTDAIAIVRIVFQLAY